MTRFFDIVLICVKRETSDTKAFKKNVIYIENTIDKNFQSDSNTLNFLNLICKLFNNNYFKCKFKIKYSKYHKLSFITLKINKID